MGSTKALPSVRTGSARPRIHSGVLLTISALSMTTARASSDRDMASTVWTASLHPLPSSSEGRMRAGLVWTRRTPSARSSTWLARSSGSVASTWMSTAVRPGRWVSIPSWTILATACTAELSPPVMTPMARSAVSARPGSAFTTADGWARSTIVSPREQGEQRQVVAQVPRDQEVAAYVLPPGRAHPPDQLWVAEQMPDAEGRAVDGLHRVAGHAEDDLDRNPSGHAADHGLGLPHGSGDVDPEARRQRLVDHDSGAALERVHLRLRIGRQPDDAQVGVIAGRLLDFRQDVVARTRRRACEHEPDVVVLLHEPVGIDHSQRVMGAIERPDLEEERLVAGNAQPVEVDGLLGAAHVAVPLGERVDGRVNDEARDG